MIQSATTAGSRHGSATITLPSDTELLITRRFDAPAALVFKAYTTPELVRRWWAGEQAEWVVCEIDLRVGGTWRYVMRDYGMEIGFHGEYREIDRPLRIVTTEVFEGFPDPEAGAVNLVTFEEADGVTTLAVLVQHTCREHRDGHLASGMESGMQLAYNRLEDVVREEV